MRRVHRAPWSGDYPFFIHTGSARPEIIVNKDLSDLVVTVEADGSRFVAAARTAVLSENELTIARVRDGSEPGFLQVTVEVPSGDGIVANIGGDTPRAAERC